MDILEVKNLTKKFGNFTALDNISFSLQEGEILGFLGQNGAGKTTTIQMLLGVLKPTSGSISYFGKDIMLHREEILENVNFSSTYTNLMWWLSVRENLHYLSYLYEIPDRKQRFNKIVELFRLHDILNLEIEQLSAGQLTRVNLAKAFLNFPKILLLDEPTASLDPEVAAYIRSFLLEERKKFGVSIIITSHNMAEIEEICDRVIVIQSGKIIANDTPHHLAKSIHLSHIELLVSSNEEPLIELLENKKLSYKKQRKLFTIEVPTLHIATFLQDVSKKGIIYDELGIKKPTLEDFFLSTIGG